MIQLAFCYDLNKIQGINVAKIINESLCFIQTKFSSNDLGILNKRFGKKIVDKIESQDLIKDFEVFTKKDLGGPSFDSNVIGNFEIQVIYYTNENKNNNSDIIDKS